MAEILHRSTTVPVAQVTDPVRIPPNHIDVTPPGKQLFTSGRLLTAIKLAPHMGQHVTVDCFCRYPNPTARRRWRLCYRVAKTMARQRGKASKMHGGLTIAQDPAEAKQPGVSKFAIKTGMVDWILTVDYMPTRLIEYHHHEKNIGKH